ncbi:MAG TPA: hypothetical protein VIR01_05880, partial [Pyrinomonadaceae bacterium]
MSITLSQSGPLRNTAQPHVTVERITALFVSLRIGTSMSPNTLKKLVVLSITSTALLSTASADQI